MQQLIHINGAPVVDNTNTQTAGPRGPALLQDIWLLEKLAHFGREVIPERRMHAKGSRAFGHFTVTHDLTHHTKARLFGAIGKTTEAFLRFSTVAGTGHFALETHVNEIGPLIWDFLDHNVARTR